MTQSRWSKAVVEKTVRAEEEMSRHLGPSQTVVVRCPVGKPSEVVSW